LEFELAGKRPKVHPDAFIAPTAVLIGDVEVEANASIWFGAVLRGDEAAIKVGEGAIAAKHYRERAVKYRAGLKSVRS
jgi:carbonic anhydrase/acetyltransferase-like protein (isoleucine patch superfamily)